MTGTGDITLEMFTTPRSLQDYAYMAHTGPDDKIAWGWTARTFSDFRQLIPWLYGYVDNRYSPAIFKNKHRNKANFGHTDTLVIDSDAGLNQCVFLNAAKGIEGLFYTTKKHTPTVPRFRFICGFSRRVTDGDEYEAIARLILHVAGVENTDGAHRSVVFRGTTPEAEIQVNPGNLVIDVDAVLKYLKGNHDFSSRSMKREPIPIPDSQFQGGNVSKRLLTSLRRIWTTTDWGVQHQREKIFGTICSVFRTIRIRSLGSFCATMRAWEVYQAWLAHDPVRSSSRDAELPEMIRNALETVIEEWTNIGRELESRNEVVEIGEDSLPKLPPELATALNKYRTTFDVNPSPLGDLPARLVWRCIINEDKVIIDAGCGLQKTTSIVCYVVVYASCDNQVWVIKRTLSDCIRTRETLVKMNRNPADISVLSGFDADACKLGLQRNDVYRAYNRSKSPCKTCSHLNECDFGKTLFDEPTLLSKPIVIMAHERYIRMLESGRIPGNVIIFADEQLADYECITVRMTDLTLIEKHVDRRFVTRFCKTRGQLTTGALGSVRDKYTLGKGKANEARKAISLSVTHSDSDRNFLTGFVNFFQDSQAIRYAVITGTGRVEAIRWIRSRVSWRKIQNNVVILDASARFAIPTFEGFRVYRLKEQANLRFPHVRLHAIRGNPTKRSMSKPDRWNEFTTTILSNLRQNPNRRVLILTNKDTPPQVMSLISAISVITNTRPVILNRGDFIGSNAGRKCDFIVIAMSMFNDIADTVLKASEIEKPEQGIAFNRVWKKPNVVNMHSGFVDETLDEVYRKIYADLLYQSIMRGKPRDYDNTPTDVVAFISDYWVLHELNRLLPSIQISTNDRTLQSFSVLRDMSLDDLLNMPDKDFQKTTGDNSRPRGKYEKQAKHYMSWIEKMKGKSVTL